MCRALFAHGTDDVDLVFHQGYQRRYDDGRTFHEQRRQLVAQRLAATCRHQHKGVLAIKHVFDNGFLIALEFVKAEKLLECFCKIFFLFCHRLLIVVIAGATWLFAPGRSLPSPQRILFV